MKPTLYGTALLRLAAHFKVGVEEFRTIPQELVLEWAKDVEGSAHYGATSVSYRGASDGSTASPNEVD